MQKSAPALLVRNLLSGYRVVYDNGAYRMYERPDPHAMEVSLRGR